MIVILLLWLPAWAEDVLATPGLDQTVILAIDGRGDMLFGATRCGLVTWQLPRGTATRTTTDHGLPSDHVLGVHLHEDLAQLLLRTDDGLIRGWPGGSWASFPTDAAADRFLCALDTSRGWIAGGAGGRLVAWQRDDTETLTVPTNSDIVGLAWAPTWAARLAGGTGRSAPQPQPSSHKTASLFAAGILAATEDDGLWLLRSLNPIRWLQLAQREGLPDDRLLHVVLDDSARAWVATRAGIARITPELHIDAWPRDALLSQRALTLWKGPSAHVYVGWWGGLFRIVTRPHDDTIARESIPWVQRPPLAGSDAPPVELLPGIHDPILSTAWANALWWTSGDSLTSFLGDTVSPPPCPPCGLGTGSRFQAAERGPHGAVHARGAHPWNARSGGSSGSRESDDSGWRWTPLPSGASGMRSTSTAAETLQVPSRCFVARRRGQRMVVRIPRMDIAELELYDVRGRSVGAWASIGPGIFRERGQSHSGQRLHPGVYFVRGVLPSQQRIRILIPR